MAIATAERQTTQPDRPIRNRKKSFNWNSGWVYLVALFTVAISIGPVLYVWINGFRTTPDINANPAGWPSPWNVDNYVAVLTSQRFWGSVFSSSVVGVGTTAGAVILGVMAAFVIARYNFKGRAGLYSLFAAGLMFPVTVAALPLSILLRDLGLQGSFLGLIIPQVAFALPVTVIILVPFLRAIPAELEEAAAIDGATRIGFFWRIVLPLSGPGLVTVGVLAFIGSWNAYLLPLLIMASGGMPQDLWTLPLGVQQFSTQYSADTGAVLAYTSLSMIPALAFFILAEKRIVGGLTGAVKG